MSTRSAWSLGAFGSLLAIGIVLVLLSCAKEGSEDLARAGMEGRLEDVKQLLDSEAEVNSQDGIGRTVLMFAADEGHLPTVRLLLKKGADVNAKTTTGETAMQSAQANHHKEIIKLLEDRGAKE